MSARTRVAAMLARVRRRAVADAALVVLPVASAAAVLAWRLAGTMAASGVALAGLVAAVIAGGLRARRFDRHRLLSQLDAARRDLDDSSSLLFADEDGLGPLQQLQRARIEQRIAETPLPELRPPWSKRAIAIAWIASAIVALCALGWPAPRSTTSAPGPIAAPAPAVPGEPRLLDATLQVQPPAYTGLEVTESPSLDAKAPAGSRLRWTLGYAPQPAAVDLVLHDGQRLPLQREGDDWTARHVLQASSLYRVVPAGVTGAESSKLHRLDAIPDQPPRVRVLAPERGLTLMAPGQRDWLLQFEVTDDHGVAPRARLQVTRTEGSGESVRFHDHVRVLEGSGDRRTKRFEVRLAPSDYGLQRGEELIARLEVLDNRAPQPQQARSASVILRWPAEPVLGAEGLEGLARQVLPAYFRSQRQIIIDAEALLREKPRLAGEEFERRSDALGVDQRLLRLRYGQFLGEESEGGSTPPTSDLPTNDAPAADQETDGAHAHDDGHDHGVDADADVPAPGGFGEVGDVLEAFGHTHDIPEAATLLDPETREILRDALREMWQSELHLRQAAPAQALPYAHRALELIKRVQQADRIYLQRVGTQLPPIDEARRLSGKRDGLGDRPLPPLSAVAGDAVLAEAWRTLDGAEPDALAARLDALQAWVDDNRARVVDPLAWIAGIDALRQDPQCASCRDELRAMLWSGMPRPAGGIARRGGDDAAAQRYLDALRAEGAQ